MSKTETIVYWEDADDKQHSRHIEPGEYLELHGDLVEFATVRVEYVQCTLCGNDSEHSDITTILAPEGEREVCELCAERAERRGDSS